MWTAIATVAGSLYSARQSRKEAQRNRQFQADMSSSAYQRAMADMRKAGLNPILAGKLGPASTPAGAMAKIPDIGQSFAQGMSTAFQGEKLSSEISKLDAEVDQLVAHKSLTEAQTANIKEVTRKVWEETNNLKKLGTKLDYENIVNAMITDFKEKHPNATIAQNYGMDVKSLKGLIMTILTTGSDTAFFGE